MNGGFPSLEHQVDVKRKVIQKMKEKKRHHKEYEKVLTLECFLVKKEEKSGGRGTNFLPFLAPGTILMSLTLDFLISVKNVLYHCWCLFINIAR